MDGPLDDDYVANLLKEDAKKANQSAALIGIRAYMPQKYVHQSMLPTCAILIQYCPEQMLKLQSQTHASYEISSAKPIATIKRSLRRRPKSEEPG